MIAIASGGLAVAAAMCYWLVLPWVVDRGARATLARHGFPEADLEVNDVGLGHVELTNVRIADGFELGSVELDSGLALLWSDPDAIAIRGARVTADGLDRVVRKARVDPGGSTAFGRVTIDDAMVTIGDSPIAGSGTVTNVDAGLDISVDIRDPRPGGWTAAAHGRITWNAAGHAMLDGGHVDAVLPALTSGRLGVTHATLTADVSGDVSARELAAEGTLAVGGISFGDVLAVQDASLPFTLAARGEAFAVDVGRGTATAVGGDLTIDPFVVGSGRPVDLVVHARGLALSRVLATFGRGRIDGTGMLDGRLALRVDRAGWTLSSGALQTRGEGMLGVNDAALRDRLAKVDSPFAVHDRIAGALADFAYDQITVELAPRGSSEPELKLVMRGRGRRVAQDLDVVVGVRGVRDVVSRFARGVP